MILVVIAVFLGEMNEDTNSSVESSYSTTNSDDSRSFDKKPTRLGDARNYQSSLYGSGEQIEYDEKSYLLA